VHCNPITHFDAFGLYDQDDIDARQVQQDEKQAQFDADFEEWKNSDISPQQRRAQAHSYANRRSELEQSQSEINDMQKELDKNRWGDTDLPNAQVNGTILIDGEPHVVNYLSDGTRVDAPANELDLKLYFYKQSDDSYIQKTREQVNADWYKPTSDTCGAIDQHLGTPMKVAGYTPAVGCSFMLNPMGSLGGALGYAGNCLGTGNKPTVEGFSISVMSGALFGRGSTKQSIGLGAGQNFVNGLGEQAEKADQ
jgi:hypothetical protein